MCLFCDLAGVEAVKVMENEGAYALFDKFPKAKGHSLVIPKAHSANFFEMDVADLPFVHDLVVKMKDKLLAEDSSIKGFNIWSNVNEVSGQSILHTHVHLIPRRENDGLKVLS